MVSALVQLEGAASALSSQELSADAPRLQTTSFLLPLCTSCRLSPLGILLPPPGTPFAGKSR